MAASAEWQLLSNLCWATMSQDKQGRPYFGKQFAIIEITITTMTYWNWFERLTGKNEDKIINPQEKRVVDAQDMRYVMET